MAELFGKDTGCSRGFGGSMHLFDVERGFLGGWAIVGGHLALAAGTAFKSKYAGEDRVTMCFFGEGSTNIGGFHEAMSLAGLWKLPVVFVCENNQYAMGTPLERNSRICRSRPKATGCLAIDSRATTSRWYKSALPRQSTERVRAEGRRSSRFKPTGSAATR